MQFTHKNIVLIFVSALVIGGAFLLAEMRNKEMKKVVYTSPLTAASADALISDLQDIDTDSDGLKDWEEVLIGSNPDVKDAEKARAAAVAKASAPVEDLTPTELLARDFFSRYMELNQTGLLSDSQSKTELITEVIKNGIVIEKPKLFTIDAIIISPDSSPEALKAYGNTVGRILKENPHPGKDEARITMESVEAEDPELLKQIDPIIANYRKILDLLLKTPAPESLSPLHLNLVNALTKFVFVSESFRKTGVDTMKGIQATASYVDAGDSMFYSVRALVNYFDNQKIIFNPTEPGTMFTKIQ